MEVSVSSSRGTLSHHPYIFIGIFHEINQPANLGYPHFPSWKAPFLYPFAASPRGPSLAARPEAPQRLAPGFPGSIGMNHGSPNHGKERLHDGWILMKCSEQLLFLNIYLPGFWRAHILTIDVVTCTYNYTARTGVLPGEVRFDCAGPVFYEIPDVIHLPRWMTKFVSKTRNRKP